MNALISREHAVGLAMLAMARREGHRPALPQNGGAYNIPEYREAGSAMTRTLEFLRDNPGVWVTAPEVAEAIGRPVRRASTALSMLKTKGLAIKGARIAGPGHPAAWRLAE